MQMVCGNRAIAEHSQNGKDVHLFIAADRRSYVQYEGQFVCTGHHSRRSLDVDGKERSAVVFELTPVDLFLEDEDPAVLSFQDDDLDRLRELALADSADARVAKARVTLARYRSAALLH
jgi:5-methylcytosine-specific restriction protein A